MEALTKSKVLTPFQAEAFYNSKESELRIGNYDVLDRLGAGGMGTVFKARHRRIKHIVALKLLSSHLAKNASFVQRFLREVEMIARFSHPNIVVAYDADEAEMGHFLVMEFVDGQDLASMLRNRDLWAWPSRSIAFSRQPVDWLMPTLRESFIAISSRQICCAIPQARSK